MNAFNKFDKVERLKRDISNAFPEVTPPYPRSLLLDQGDEDLESAEIRASLAGKDWREIEQNELIVHLGGLSILSLLSPVGFQYYLPAFLHTALEIEPARRVSANVILEVLLLHLSPHTLIPDFQEEFNHRMNLLTSEQKRCIRQFVELISENHLEAFIDEIHRSAVREYWQN